MKRPWRAALALVAQGCKEITLAGHVYHADTGYSVATPIVLPVTSRICVASPAQPFLCLWIDFDPRVVSEVAALVGDQHVKETTGRSRGVFVSKTTDQMLEAAIRLGRLFQMPEDAPALGALVIREIFYYLLKGVDGAAIRQFVNAGSKVHQVSQAIYLIEANLKEDVNVMDLACSVNMSRSAFFECFKEVTAMSPIQYQKRLRLLEARRLMVDTGESAASAASKVGYKSASQFSREYSRLFGDAPLRNALKIKKSACQFMKIRNENSPP